VLKAKEQFNSESGVTLVELMVVTVIIAIVATVAIVYQSGADKQYQRQNGSRQLKEAFERARFDSVKRRADGTEPYAQVEVRTDRFILTTYTKESNGTATARIKETILPSGVVINHYSSGTLPMTVTFDRRGETAGGIPQFRVCNSTCSSPTRETSDILLITPTGTVNLLTGDSSIPNFNNPSLNSNVGSGDGINNKVVMP
jgi:prepilin-type N-terminal cleavage/methylation domain-containing protein